MERAWALRDQLTRTFPPSWRKRIHSARRTARAVRSRLTPGDIVTLDGVRLAARPHEIGGDVVGQIRNGDYEAREARMVRRFLAPEDTVLELGAGVGFIGLLCARVVGPERVHSFEANPLMEPVIRANYALNELHPHLTIGFLGEKGEDVTLYVPPLFWAASTSPIEGAREVTTPSLDLNEAVRRIRPTFLIMDIEGGEIDVIDRIDTRSLRKVAMETHPDVVGPERLEAMFARLAALGFVERWRSNAGCHVYFEKPGTGAVH